MGQSISRRVVPFLERATAKKDALDMKDVLSQVAKKKADAGKYGGFTDPSAVNGGFRREESQMWPQEREQEKFLQESYGGKDGDGGPSPELNEVRPALETPEG